jgi:hypothetical protein
MLARNSDVLKMDKRRGEAMADAFFAALGLGEEKEKRECTRMRVSE